jgi:hypothetical protein
MNMNTAVAAAATATTTDMNTAKTMGRTSLKKRKTDAVTVRKIKSREQIKQKKKAAVAAAAQNKTENMA